MPAVAEGYNYKGGVEKEGKLYFGNLVYDGETLFNFKKGSGDSNTEHLLPVYTNLAGNLRYRFDNHLTELFEDTTTYKPTLAQNYLIFSEMSPISAIDKLLDKATILYKKMAANEQIRIEYSLDNMATWVVLGTQTYASGDTSTKNDFNAISNVSFTKIFWKISMKGSATSPEVYDFIMAHRPMPYYKNQWALRVECSDGVKLLNGQSEERSGADLLSELWNEKIVKQKITFEDVDYVECTLLTAMSATQTSASVNSTKRFPRKGRIRAVSGSIAEEMYYTSATTIHY